MPDGGPSTVIPAASKLLTGINGRRKQTRSVNVACCIAVVY